MNVRSLFEAKSKAGLATRPGLALASLAGLVEPRSRSAAGAALLATLLAAVAFALACALPTFAFADEGEDQESSANKVYVNQLSDSSFLYETSIADLAQADSYYEGQTVLVTGEVVGDCVNDELNDSNCWITLQDDEENPSVVSVFMSKDQASVIDTYGAYGTVGTQLQVRGVFHLECQEHQGQSDIHAEEVSALAEGHADKPTPDMNLLAGAAIACAIGLALMVAYYFRREKML